MHQKLKKFLERELADEDLRHANGCILVKLAEGVSPENYKNPTKNQYLIRGDDIYFWGYSDKEPIKLSFVDEKTPKEFNNVLKFDQNRIATEEDLKLITSYTGHRTHTNLFKFTRKKSEKTEKDQHEAALRIQNAWRRHKVQQDLSKDSYQAYQRLLPNDEVDKTLGQYMFGKTNSIFESREAMSFFPQNPYIPSKITAQTGYYRTDPVEALEDITDLVKKYDSNPDFKNYNYIPITLSRHLSVEALIQDYAPQYKDQIQIIKHGDSSLAFIKVSKNDQQFFLLKKFLFVFGFFSGNFTSRSCGLALKASYWQIARNKQKISVKEGNEQGTLDKLKFRLPQTLSELKSDSRMVKLRSIASNDKICTQHVAACLLNLIEKIPDDASINQEAIKRIAFFVELASTLYEYNYTKFSFILYSVIHELTVLLEKKELKIDYEKYKEITKNNTSKVLDLPKDAEKLQYVSFPAYSGTNAILLTLDIAKKANQGKTVNIRSEGALYFELNSLGLVKVTKEEAEHEIYLITNGPTVWTGVSPGLDINKVIRDIIKKNNGIAKPMTLVVDSTSGMHRHLKVDPELKKYILDGTISILVTESRQKFGLAHSDQAQFGQVYGVCSKDVYSDEFLSRYNSGTVAELQDNLDLQIGSYLTMCAEEPLERIKEKHFRNGKYLRDFFSALGLGETIIVDDKNNIDDPERGLYVYIKALGQAGKAIKKHIEHRNAFGHFNTTWCDCGPYVRMAPSASDKIDIYIEAAELYFAVKSNKQELSNELFSLVRKNPNPMESASISDQIMLAGLLQALRHGGYKPKTLAEHFTWNYAIKYMREQCPELVGRKSYHAQLEAQQNYLAQVQSGDLAWIHNIFFKFSKKDVSFTKIPELLSLTQEYERAYKNERNQKKMLGLQASIILQCSTNLKHDVKENKEVLLNNPSMSKAVIALDKHNLLSKEAYSSLFLTEKRLDTVHHNAIYALSEMGLLTPSSLNRLITRKQGYEKDILFLYDVHCLIQNTTKRMAGFKPTVTEKKKLGGLITSLNTLKKNLENNLFLDHKTHLSKDECNELATSFQDYIDFAKQSKSNIFKRFVIALKNLISQIRHYGKEPGPARGKIEKKLSVFKNKFTTFQQPEQSSKEPEDPHLPTPKNAPN